MTKEVIETLIELTQNEINELNFNLEMNTVNLNRLKEVASNQVVMRFEKVITKIRSGLIKYQNCLYQLNKLKEFEFPTDKEIEKLSNEYAVKKTERVNYNTEFKKLDHFQGAIIMRDHIKQKLS